MCGNHDLIETVTPDELALIAARERAEKASGLHAGHVDASLPVIGSGSAPALPDVLPAAELTARVEIAVVVAPEAAPVLAIKRKDPVHTAADAEAEVNAAKSGAPVETKESLQDALLAAFYAETAAARAAIVTRVAVALNLPKGSDIAATRTALASLVKVKTIKETDLVDWLKVPSITSEITAALKALVLRNRDNVKLSEINDLRRALGIKLVDGNQNWRNQACGQMMVGQVYEELVKRGYTGELPPVFQDGLKKYRAK